MEYFQGRCGSCWLNLSGGSHRFCHVVLNLLCFSDRSRPCKRVVTEFSISFLSEMAVTLQSQFFRCSLSCSSWRTHSSFKFVLVRHMRSSFSFISSISGFLLTPEKQIRIPFDPLLLGTTSVFWLSVDAREANSNFHSIGYARYHVSLLGFC